MIVGTEWLIEAAGCEPEALRDETRLRSLLDRVIAELGLTSVGSVWHKFDGEGGVTGLIALTESHLACHTYPEHGTATFNLYCCRTRPEWDWEGNLRSSLGARDILVHRIERGPVDRTQRLVGYGEIERRERGRLPHWEKDEGIYFVTFRLADSLPQHVLDELELARKRAEQVLDGADRKLSLREKRKLDWLFSEKVDGYLDQNFGDCTLRDPRAAEIAAEALRHFDGVRYHLYAWCIMPNHGHVVFKALGQNKLDAILHSWKSYTTHEINKSLGRTGKLWQREYYDHLVRNSDQLEAVISYTMNNPKKARLGDWRWVDGPVRYKAAKL